MSGTKLSDKNNIIIHFPLDKSFNLLNDSTMASYLENFILSNNYLFHPSFFHHIMKENFSKIDQEKLYKSIFKFTTTYLRSIRNNFRALNKKNKLELSVIIDFINDYYSKVQKIDCLLKIFSPDLKYDSNLKWGNTELIKLCIFRIYELVLSDNIIKQSIKKFIAEYSDKRYKNDLSKLMNYINVFEKYYEKDSKKSQLYFELAKHIDEILYSSVHDLEVKMDDKVKSLYQFKYYSLKYMEITKRYYYIYSLDNSLGKLSKFIGKISDTISYMVSTFDVKGLKQIFISYKDHFNFIFKSKNFDYLSFINTILDKPISDFKDLIEYYNDLLKYDFIKQRLEFKTILSQHLLNSADFFEFVSNSVYKNLTFENTKILADFTNNCIINQTNYDIFYLIINNCLNFKDELMALMESNLIKRLMYTQNSSVKQKVENEINFVNKYSVTDSKLFFKYKNIISDFNNTIEKKINNVDLFQTIISENTWNINTSFGNMTNVDDLQYGIFSRKIRDINHEYLVKSDHNKYLVHYLHMGSIKITFHGDKKAINISMLPAHMLILELFNEDATETIGFDKWLQCEKCKKWRKVDEENFIEYKNDFSCDKLECFSCNLPEEEIEKEYTKIYNSEILKKVGNLFQNYPKKFIVDIIESMIISGLIKKKLDYYYLNTDYSETDYIDLIDIYNNISNYDFQIDSTIKNTIIHTKQDILTTIISHHLKHNEMLEYSKLLGMSKNNKFNLTPELFNQTLELMIQKDYIKKVEGNNYQKILV